MSRKVIHFSKVSFIRGENYEEINFNNYNFYLSTKKKIHMIIFRFYTYSHLESFEIEIRNNC